MPDWTERTPLRVVTGYHNVARQFFADKGFENVVLLSADGALEAAPLMGTADIILDLVRPSGCDLCAFTTAVLSNNAPASCLLGLVRVVHNLWTSNASSSREG